LLEALEFVIIKLNHFLYLVVFEKKDINLHNNCWFLIQFLDGKCGIDHKICIAAYAIEQQLWESVVPKKLKVINVIKVQKWCLLFSNACKYVALFQKFVDTPVNGRPSLFRIDSAHQMETSLSHALLVC
jgi:hypothetical protein